MCKIQVVKNFIEIYSGNYIHVNIKRLDKSAIMPTRAMPFAARVDVYSTKEYEVQPYDKMFIDMGIVMQIPVGYQGEIAPCSGLVYHYFLDYMGSFKVLIYNFGKQPYVVKP